MEEAAAYIQNQNQYNIRMAHIKHLLQIRGRRLTTAEERYAHQWSEMGFDDETILMAYERTCINTGGLKWPYMNSILKRWHDATRDLSADNTSATPSEFAALIVGA